ncbi:penicillin-binding protein [Sneathiella chinensis]|uniref:peptidoglycan glycosyltransferase n=1 Tax=Sneathiella chinensis TaxID=349750 RepID=A0ABQ5TYB5_9PROT|nr:penicillin-binding protein [Sneathiella chinensis]
MRPLINWGGTLVLWGVLISGVILGYFAYTLPDISGINVIEKRPSLVFQTEKGVRFATYGDLYGNMLRPDEIPENMKNAVMAVEDSHFYDHFGVNPFSLVRAMWRNYQAGRVVEGGSTITQQLAKNLFLNPDRTLQRKIREVLLAFWLEANYSKDEILALYLNRMYFGSGTYGIDAAARKYFSKPARDLTIAEAAMLAGLLKAPTYYAPTANLDRAQQRSTVVIRRMEAEEFITPATANALVKAPATLRNAGSNFRNVRYFSDWVVSEVRSYIGRTEEDLIVRTTLDLDLQTNAEQSLESQLKTNSKKYNVSQAALITMTPTGAVKAMVGGRNYARSSFNRAVSAQRQPGSVFKTVVYTAGFEKGRAPDDVYMDGPVNIGGWKPHNYSRRYDGAMSLREAYSRSINTIAVKLTEDIGRGAVASTARKMGLTGKIPTHPSISLGTNEVSLVEMTSAYAVIANGGYGVLPYGVLEIKTASGKVLYQRHGSGLGRQLSARTVNHMRSIMTTAIQSGTGRNANPGFPAAGKTGTTQDYRDAWFIGFTPSLVTGVWFGNDDGSATKKVTGSNLPALAWRDFMKASTGASDRIAFAREKEPLSDSSIWQKIIQTFGSSSTPARSGSGTSNPVPGVPEYPTGATDRP